MEKAFPPAGIVLLLWPFLLDFDNDNDLDLFVGARSLSRNYGEDPTSIIFINDGKGNLREFTQSKK